MDPAAISAIATVIVAGIGGYVTYKVAQLSRVVVAVKDTVNTVEKNTNSIATANRETAAKTLESAVRAEKLLGEATAALALLQGEIEGRAKEKADQALRATIPVTLPAIATVPVPVPVEPPMAAVDTKEG